VQNLDGQDPAHANPYGGDQAQEEEEYKPVEEPAQPNPYGQADDGAHPVGFGAERANLMNEAEVNMDQANNIQVEKEIPAGGDYEENKGSNAVDEQLKAQADQAKNEFLNEINALHGQSAVANAEIPDEA